MKKSLLVFCIGFIAFSLSAFAIAKWSKTNPPSKVISCTTVSEKKTEIDFFYGIESRFMRTVTKDLVDNAKTFIEIFPERTTKDIESWNKTEVVIVNGDDRKIVKGYGSELNAAQKNIFTESDYSTNFYVNALCTKRNAENNNLRNDSIVHWMTIVPENEAKYADGMDTLIDYLKESSRDDIAIITDNNISPGRVYFTVTKNGTLDNIQLNSSCGYPTVDEAMLELLSNLPGVWIPASNSEGALVNQQLVFFFGNFGC